MTGAGRRGRGVVLIDKTVVGEWKKVDEEFVIKKAAIDSKQVGFQGDNIQELWDAEMMQKPRE